jgi:phosphatidylserine decarboxylase
MTFAKESWPFVLPAALLAALLALFGDPILALVALLLAVGLLLFFRDPVRRFAGAGTVILAPGEGVVTAVDEIEDPEIGPGKHQRIVTFLSVFNVHVQRVPCSGTVVSSVARDGRKRAAFHPDIDRDNAWHLTVIERPNGDRVAVRQIVGLIARRVVCYLSDGQPVERGQLLGVIKFGSRVDLMVPPGYRVLVRKGQKVRNGETPLAEAPANADQVLR